MNVYSQVQYLASHEEYSCGYCKSPNTNFSHGLWTYVLTVEDYQNLIDRGWRRCGMHCYKPTNDKTCCPMYTIRCEAANLKLSKSQKKILKKVLKFLKDGTKDTKKEKAEDASEDEAMGENISDAAVLEEVLVKVNVREAKLNEIDPSIQSNRSNDQKEISTAPKSGLVSSDDKEFKSQGSSECTKIKSDKDVTRLKATRSGDGIDPSKPQCKKAKIIRLERKQKKAQQKNDSTDFSKINQSKEKTLEDFIKESVESSSTNKLELRLVPSNASNPEFKATFEESYQLYVKYQVSIHKDSPSKCTRKGYSQFLIKSPLQPFKDDNGPPSGYGSFHQQYWLNGKLIAVGVLDILPKCVSSVYFFYDPDYSFLSLGSYGSLRELELVRTYVKKCPELQFYYMGFYIHSCPKMRYKARLNPSYLLCPEVYTWHRIEQCIPKLDVSKYTRLNEDIDAVCLNSIIPLSQVLVLWNYRAMTYGVYRSQCKANDEDEVKEYAELVGRNTSQNMLLFRE